MWVGWLTQMSWLHSSGLSEKFNVVGVALEKGVYLQWEQVHQLGKGVLAVVEENGRVLNSSDTASSECHSFYGLLGGLWCCCNCSCCFCYFRQVYLDAAFKKRFFCLWMAASVCLLPPIPAPSFASPGNGGIKLGLVDEVRAAVAPIPVQDLIPLFSEVWGASSHW